MWHVAAVDLKMLRQSLQQRNGAIVALRLSEQQSRRCQPTTRTALKIAET
jgi:hypothetical protein